MRACFSSTAMFCLKAKPPVPELKAVAVVEHRSLARMSHQAWWSPKMCSVNGTQNPLLECWPPKASPPPWASPPSLGSPGSEYSEVSVVYGCVRFPVYFPGKRLPFFCHFPPTFGIKIFIFWSHIYKNNGIVGDLLGFFLSIIICKMESWLSVGPFIFPGWWSPKVWTLLYCVRCFLPSGISVSCVKRLN